MSMSYKLGFSQSVAHTVAHTIGHGRSAIALCLMTNKTVKTNKRCLTSYKHNHCFTIVHTLP